MKLSRLLPCVALAGACSTGPAIPAGRLPAGPWGGEHLLMLVADSAAALEFDCAAGRIPGPLLVEEGGRFTWAGTFTPGLGGPVREDHAPRVLPATYAGRTDGTRMTLELRLPDSAGIAPQSFDLVRGRDARVFKCL